MRLLPSAASYTWNREIIYIQILSEQGETGSSIGLQRANAKLKAAVKADAMRLLSSAASYTLSREIIYIQILSEQGEKRNNVTLQHF